MNLPELISALSECEREFRKDIEFEQRCIDSAVAKEDYGTAQYRMGSSHAFAVAELRLKRLILLIKTK